MGKKTQIKPIPVKDEPNPRLLLDERLRRNGFAIYSRPLNGEAIWVKEGKKYTQIEAVNGLPSEDPKPTQTTEVDEVDEFE